MEKYNTNYITNEQVEIFMEEFIIFLRKSRSDNPNEAVEDTLKRHEKQLQEKAKELTGKEIKEDNIYREVVSGGEELENRPEFMKVIKRLEKGNIKGVLVVDPQRLSRSGMYGAGDIINAFYHTNTLIITPHKTYDLKNRYDKKFIEMELIQGAEYLEYTKEKLLNGRITSVKEGKYIGSVTPFGYDKEKIKDEKGYKLVINDKEAEVVRMIFDLCLDGIGTSNIANTLNKLKMESRTKCTWTPQMIRNILENETYYGMIMFNKRKEVVRLIDGAFKKSRPVNDDYILIKGLHEPIISEAEFRATRQILKSNPRPKTKNNDIKNPLATLVKCSICDHTMIRRPYNRRMTKNPKRIHDIDKSALLELLRTKKQELKLSINQIKDSLKISRDQAAGWFTPNVNKFYVSKTFSDKWFDMKALLEIETNEFDKPLTEYGFDQIRPDTLMCSLAHCETVSSDLHKVEARILEALEAHLNDYNFYLNNYEEEIIKEAQDNAKHLKRINDGIEKVNKLLKNARRNYNAEEISYEEYMEDKAEYERELNSLESARALLIDTQKEDKIIRYKKAIPKLEDCIKNYNTLTLAQKNELLKAIIKNVTYTKTENGRWNPNADFTLHLELKI